MDYFTRREFTSIMPQVQIRGHVLWCVDEELAIAWLTHTEKDTKYEPPPVVVIAWKDVRTVLEVIYHWRNTTREGFDTSWSVDIEGILYAR
jgi:hypothetical protein